MAASRIGGRRKTAWPKQGRTRYVGASFPGGGGAVKQVAGWGGPGGTGGMALVDPPKKAGKKRKAKAAKKTAARKTSRKAAARKTTARKAAPRKAAAGRRKPRGKKGFGGAIRYRSPATNRQVTIVAPHRSGGRPCVKCGKYHGLEEHWSHEEGPHNYLTKTEKSYMCKRFGICPTKPKPKPKAAKKKTAAKRKKKGKQPTMTRKQACMVLCRQKWAKKAKKKK